MTSQVDDQQPEKPIKPGEPLPPVEAPTSAFFLQLFLIPMIIVTIIVSVWLMFSWLAHMGSDPQKLVQDIRKMNSSSWQKALVLANMLRNQEYDHLKDDDKLAGDLADLLKTRLDAGSEDDRGVKLRRFLCRAIGEFRTPVGMPVLLVAAKQEKNPRDLEVRRSAVAAIAILTSNVGPETLQGNSDLVQTLIEVSRERSENGDDKADRAALRSTAAFALGVLGGQEASDRLAQMTIDAEPDVRYNAAIGLARMGDPRATPVILQMLDPDNEQAVQGEKSEAAREMKRLDVMTNAIRASIKLRKQNQDWDDAELLDRFKMLAKESPLPPVQIAAQDALAKWKLAGAEPASKGATEGSGSDSKD